MSGLWGMVALGLACVGLTAAPLLWLLRRNRRRMRTVLARDLHSQNLEAVGSMAGGIAHDFNNVLTVAQGSTELARDLAPPGGPQFKLLDQGLLALGRGRDLVRSLMLFIRRQAVPRRRLDLAVSVRDSLPLLRKLLKPGVTLDVELKPVLVLADPLQLERILMNLMVNADQAMPLGGHLRLSCSQEDAWALLKVADDGKGMTQCVQDRIFEPHYTTKGLEGSGLGLATVQGIVAELGGSIVVASAPGTGSHFTVRLPTLE